MPECRSMSGWGAAQELEKIVGYYVMKGFHALDVGLDVTVNSTCGHRPICSRPTRRIGMPPRSRAAGGVVQPERKYARLGHDRIAYQVLGQGPPDLVLTLNSFGHVDIAWEDPGTPCSCARWHRSPG
jgi:hypothetical protein